MNNTPFAKTSIHTRVRAVALCLFCWPAYLSANVAPKIDYDFLGVVSSICKPACKGAQHGVVVVKSKTSKTTHSVRVGNPIDRGSHILIHSVTAKIVTLRTDSGFFNVKVGTDQDVQAAKIAAQTPTVYKGQFEREGNTLKVPADLKRHVLETDLSNVLMQAAAVAHIENGRLAGFALWDIQKDSLFENLGIQDGDIVTAIDGKDIRSAGRAIQQLNSLKNATSVQFTIKRNGNVIPLKLEVL